MSPEFYVIIGVGVSTIGFLAGLTAVTFYLLSQVNRRIDRLEDKFDQLLTHSHSRDIQVEKLEWMLDAALRGRPVALPHEADDVAAAN